MKKLAIAGASVALAAMPIVGVFADNVTTTEDTLTLTVEQGCNIINEATSRTDKTAAFGTVTPGLTKEDGTSPITITCNGGWKVTPSISSALSNGTATIASGAAALDGTVSEWALSIATSGSATGLSNGFSSYHAVDGSTIVSATGGVESFTLTPTYKVSVAPGQATGSYTGTVLYTVANNS